MLLALPLVSGLIGQAAAGAVPTCLLRAPRHLNLQGMSFLIMRPLAGEFDLPVGMNCGFLRCRLATGVQTVSIGY